MTARHAGVEVGVGLGSNLGNKVEMVRRALALLQQDGVLADVTVSRLYRTAPWGPVEQDWFVNACAVGFTQCKPADLLVRVKRLERQLGRTDTMRWGPRVIDIDILYYGDLVVDTPGLTLPHREIPRRAFVLVPLAEIRPDRKIGDQTVRAAAEALGTEGVDPLPDEA